MPLSELKGCPFCGSKAHTQPGIYGYLIWVGCPNPDCGMSPSSQFYSEAKAVKAWNAREQRSKAEASLGGEGFSSSSADSATRRPSDGCDTEAQSPAGGECSAEESAVYPGSPIIRELQAIRIGMLDHYQAATILERLVGQARSLPIPAPAEARSEQAAPPSSEEQPLHSEPQASSSCQARDEQGFSSPLPPPIREENQP